MAGVQGMGSPNQVEKPVSPELNIAVPEGMAFQAPTDSYVDAPKAKPSLDEIFGQAQASKPSLDEIFNGPQAELPVEDVTPSLFEQAKQFPARLEASFAATPKEQKFVLERRYGADNVRQRGEDFQIKKGEKWIPFDSSGFEILNDIIGDMGRGVIEQGATELATAGGMGVSAALAPVTAGVSVAASPVTVAASRLAGGAIGSQVADLVAENIFDIPRDPERSRVKEAASSAVINATFGKVGDMVSSYFAKKGAEKATRLMGQKVDDVLKADIDMLRQADNELKQAGLLQNVDTAFGSTSFLPEQAVKEGAPDITFRAKIYADNPEVIRVKAKLGEGAQNVIKQINDKIAAVVPTTGKDILAKAQNIELEEGKLIGSFRNEFLKEAGDGVVPLPATREALQKVQDTLGYVPGSSEAPKDAASLMLQKRFEKFYNAVSNNGGRVQAEDLAGFYDDINKATQNSKLWTKQNKTVQEDALLDLWRGVRDDYSQAIETTLGDKLVNGKTYTDSLKRFTEIKNATKDLKSLLIDPATGEATITAEALAQNIFGNTKATAKDIQAAKVLFKDDPEVWNQIRRIRLDDMLKKSYNSTKESFDGVKFVDSITSLPNEVAEELAGGKEGLNLLKAARTYSNRLQNYSVENMSNEQDAKNALSKLLAFSSNYVQAKGLAIYDLFAATGKNRSVAKYLDGAGRDEMLKLTPVDSRSKVNKAIDYIIDAARESDGRAARAAKFVAPRATQMKTVEESKK